MKRFDIQFRYAAADSKLSGGTFFGVANDRQPAVPLYLDI